MRIRSKEVARLAEAASNRKTSRRISLASSIKYLKQVASGSGTFKLDIVRRYHAAKEYVKFAKEYDLLYRRKIQH